MRVLVTGHTGFIGSNMFNFLKSKNIDVIGYSRGTGQDIFNLKQLNKFVKRSDVVYNFAAYAKPGESIKKPMAAIKINIDSCLNVLETCRKHGVPLIYPSSCEIYGNSNKPITENESIKPTNPYAASKAAADRICYSYYESYGIDVKIVRLFNPYGPRQQLNKIAPIFYSKAIKNEDLPVYGKGKDSRDYVFISDIVKGLWAARNLPSGETINLATRKETTNLEFAKMILKITNSHSIISFVDYPEEFGNIKNQVGSFDKAKKLLGWSPKVKLEDGLKMTIRWLESQRFLI